MIRTGRTGRLRLVAVISIATVGLAGCGGGGDTERQRAVEQIDEGILPDELVGLTVAREDIKKQLRNIERPYLDTLGLFSFRRDELLQATLQVSEFAEDARWRSGEFRRSIARQIAGSGASLPQFRIGGRTVFMTGDSRQITAVWFDQRLMMVLVTRTDFTQPRALLRELITIDIGAEP